MLVARYLLLLTSLMCLGHVTCAQVTVTGEMAGTVVDASGAVVAGAQLTLHDLATSSSVTITSNQDGGYRFSHLRPGAYRLNVTSQGFRQSVYGNIVVDAGRTTNLNVALQVGEVSQTVEVTAAPPIVETTSSTISTTVRVEDLNALPLAVRDLLAFSLLTPGAQQPAGSERFSTFNGLPGGAINITLDGINNNSQRFHSGDTSMFTFAPLRLGAIEQVTISTAGLSADAAGEGATQLRFVTKRGSNAFHGNVFEQFRNDALNANDWFSNATHQPRQRLHRNEFGGSLGGPLWKNRLFFFVNYEESRQPSTSLRMTPVLTSEAQSGVFRYRGTDNIVHTGNLLQLAAAAGLPSTIDPAVNRELQSMNGFAANGSLVGRDLFTNSLNWNQPGNTVQRYPTVRVDYQITPKLLWYGTWNLQWRKILGTPNYPGAPVATNSFKSTYYIASSALDWTISTHLLNQFNFGVQGNVELFNGENKFDVYNAQNNRILTLPFNIATTIPGFVFPQPRNNPVYNYYDNLTWSKGNHTLTFGAAILHTSSYQFTFGTVGLPQYSFAVASSDTSLTNVIKTGALPSISTADLANAQALYALLTGRVSSVTGTRAVSEVNKQYSSGNPLVLRDANTQGGIYGQDSWRVTPRFTLNYGLRWELSGAAHNTNGVYTSPDYANLLGPSTRVFQPGTLNGVANPAISLRPYVYKGSFVNPAPNLGFAWNPLVEKGWLAKLTGGDATVLRGSFSISYFHEGLNTFESVASGNPGATQNLSASASSNTLTPGSVTLAGPVPTLNTVPASFSFPLPESLFTFNNSFASANPHIHTPYVESWNFGIQRRLGKNTAIEARYVGNHSVHLWRIFNLNEVNIFENGFLREFQNAQTNLAINTANGRAGFKNNGLPGQVPLPIFLAAFAALGGQPALADAQGFSNLNFVTLLQNGQAGALANSLAGNATYLCRLVGSKLPACTTGLVAFNAPGAFPINFFQANPFAAGSLARLLSDPSSGNYHGLQIQLRQSNFHGLSLTANYTWSHSITDRYGDLNSDAFDFFTLRNTRLNRGPAQFDVRHSFQTYFGYSLPFGRERHFKLSNPVLNGVLGGWSFASIIRGNSGRVFQLNSGRSTVNQRDSGVVLVGITPGQLQSMVSTRPGPNGSVLFVDPKLIGSDGRANPAFVAVPTTPGQYGEFIYLYGPSFWNVDADLEKEFPVTERVRITFQSLFLNVLNHPNFLVGTSSFLPGNSGTSVGGNVQSIQSTTFGQTSSLANSPRNIQLRLQVRF